MRRLLVAVLGLGLAALLVVAPGVSPAAQAASIVAPGIPGPLNVDPALLTASEGNFVGTRGAAYIAQMLSGFIKDGTFFTAAANSAAGVATPVETAQVADTVSKYRLPAFAASPLMKTIGGAGVVMSGFDVGGMMGNGVVEAVGIDANGSVCAQASELLAFLAHTDCTAYKLSQNFPTNSGQFAGYTSTVCDGGACMKLNGQAVISNYSNFYTTSLSYCFVSTGGSLAHQVLVHFDAAGRSAFDGTATASVFTAGQTGGPADALSASFYSMSSRPQFLASVPPSSCTGGTLAVVTNLATSAGGNFTQALVDAFHIPAPSGLSLNVSGAAVSPVTVSDGNPSRVTRCTLTLMSGAVLAADSSPWTEGGSVGIAAPTCPKYPLADPPATRQITEVGGGETVPLTPVVPTTPEYQASATSFPECMTGLCMLDLKSNATGAPVSCFSSPAGCADWYSDPNKSSDYTCSYGIHVVDLSKCAVYAPTFKPDATANGQAYGDPATGQALPGSSPGSAVAPGTAVSNPEQSRDCFPTGWAAFNPVEWVLKPVGCALQWAFVPRDSAVKSSNNSLRSAITASGVGTILGIIAGWASFPITGDGCGGIPWHFQVYTLNVNASLLAACPGDPLQPTAAVIKPILTAVVITVGVLTSVRYVAAIFGYVGFGGIVEADRRESSRNEAAAVDLAARGSRAVWIDSQRGR